MADFLFEAGKLVAKTTYKGAGLVAGTVLDEGTIETIDKKVKKVITVGRQLNDALVEETCDDQVKAAIAFCEKLIQKTRLEDKILKAREVGKPLTLILALMCRLSHHTKKIRVQEECCEPANLTMEEFSDAKTIALWAINVYKATWNPDKIHTKMKFHPDVEILMTFFKDDDSVNDRHYAPKFMIFVHTETKSIVLAIRGTNDLNDAVIDLLAEQEEFLDGTAHSGMLQAAFRVMNDSAKVLKDAFQTYPDYRLVITGHSLGAGVSAIIHLGIRAGTFQEVLPSNIPLKTVLLAPPPIYKAPEIPEELTNEIFTFVVGNDCIPRASISNMRDFFEDAYELGKVDFTQSQIHKLLSGEKDEEVVACLEAMKEATSKARRTSMGHRLNHVGNTYYLSRHDKKVFKVNGSFFSNRFLLLKRSILDHKAPNYEKAFENVDNFTSV